MIYYSTNKDMETVYSILMAQRQKVKEVRNLWKNIQSHIDWDLLWENACLLEGQTAFLGFDLEVEADYWAPQRVWIHFHKHTEEWVSIEFHQQLGLKKVEVGNLTVKQGSNTKDLLKLYPLLKYMGRAFNVLHARVG